jgi:hypothetical protein
MIVMKKAFFSFVAVLFSTMVALAQDGGGKDVNINVNTKGNAWYSSPWVWVVGAAVFILLLVALTRGSGRRAD